MKRTIKKLQLNTQTVRLLDESALKTVQGGMMSGTCLSNITDCSCGVSCGGTCAATCNNSCNTAATSCDFCIRR